MLAIAALVMAALATASAAHGTEPVSADTTDATASSPPPPPPPIGVTPTAADPLGRWEDPGFLRVTTSPALPAQITVENEPADSWGLTWTKREPGFHRVCFSDVAGFTTPNCRTAVIAEGSTRVIEGTYTARGYLRVLTSPPLPSTISVDGIPRNDWGMWTDVPVGSYEVCYGEVAGFDAPVCETAEVTAGTNTTVTGTFVENASALDPTGHGYLRATTNPAVPSQITIDDEPADTWGLTWVKLTPGTYEICYSDVEGFVTPDCRDIDVVAGETTTTQGDFSRLGLLQVSTSPPAQATVIIDGVPRNDWGMFTWLEPGTYEVCLGDVPGFLDPGCESVTVLEGQTVSHTVTFENRRSASDRTDDIAGEQFHVIYAIPSDGTDRGFDGNGAIEDSVRVMDDWLAAVGGERLRLDTYGGNLDVTFVTLDRTDAELAGAAEGDTLGLVVESLGRLGKVGATDKKYLIYYDGSNAFSCGSAESPGDHAIIHLGADPGTDDCDAVPFTVAGAAPWYLEFAALHEIFHMLGAVPSCAPNFEAGGHVPEASDLMYGGTEWSLPATLDVGGDDYWDHSNGGCLDVADSAWLTTGAASQWFGSISGTVTDPADSPAAGVEVQVTGTMAPGTAHATTAADGSYTVTGLVADSYTVYFTDDTLPDEWYDDVIVEGDAEPVEVTGGAAVTGIDAQLALGGSISGVVTDENDQPVEGAIVLVLEAGTLGDDVGTAFTNASGEYTVDRIPAGSYSVLFTEGNFLEFYDDVSILTPGNADLVTVTEGGSTTGIDAKLDRSF